MSAGSFYMTNCESCGELINVSLDGGDLVYPLPLVASAPGSSLPNRAPAPPRASSSNAADPTGSNDPSERFAMALGCLVMLGIFVGVPLLIWALLSGRIALPHEADDGNNKFAAQDICQVFVKRTLTWPDTADFSDTDAAKTGQLTWTVNGTVAAEGDVVGRKYRQHYTCSVKYQGDRHWVLTRSVEIY